MRAHGAGGANAVWESFQEEPTAGWSPRGTERSQVDGDTGRGCSDLPGHGLGSGGKGIQVVGEGGGVGRERALCHKPSSQHLFPELQEALKTEQETAIIRFAF